MRSDGSYLSEYDPSSAAERRGAVLPLEKPQALGSKEAASIHMIDTVEIEAGIGKEDGERYRDGQRLRGTWQTLAEQTQPLADVQEKEGQEGKEKAWVRFRRRPDRQQHQV